VESFYLTTNYCRYNEGKKAAHGGHHYEDDNRSGFQGNFSSISRNDTNRNSSLEGLETEDNILKAIHDLENELDLEFLTKWASALDFEDYVENWMGISTTGRSDGKAYISL
jgi:hypothetical protein